MSAFPATVAGFLARYAALRTALPGDPAARDAAAAALRALGLPGTAGGRRAEAWKYTSLRALTEAPLADLASTITPELPAPLAPARLVVIDGRFRPELSTLPDAVHLTGFAAAPTLDPEAGADHSVLAALNTLFAADGVSITVAPGIDAGMVELLSLTTPGQAAHPRHAVTLGEGARLTLIETIAGTGRALHNPLSVIRLAPGAVLTHPRVQTESAEAFHLARIVAILAADAAYHGFTLTAGAALARTDLHITLAGPGAMAEASAALLLSGTRHADLASVIRHAAPGGSSRQLVRSVLTGAARGVFQGRIEVARDAQKTDGYQMSQALLLSDSAEMDVKPELEIFADDVKCSHGATVGALDPDQLFYLRARGIPAPDARAMLVRAFLDDQLDAVPDAAARAAMEAAVASWWDGHGA
ncbi:MAG: Fe-S cluster assembly protein SufD [Acetobacteraceae bacterium]